VSEQEYVVKISVHRHMLTESKSPPLCDFCNSPVASHGDDPGEEIEVMALVQNYRITHVLCKTCRQKAVPDVKVVSGEQEQKAERALVDVLGKDPEVKFL